ncbi:unnamed protein product [Penicillium nalgiovense]|nr:unnamed protein product [Penicillium nalgiovense]
MATICLNDLLLLPTSYLYIQALHLNNVARILEYHLLLRSPYLTQPPPVYDARPPDGHYNERSAV